MVNARRLTDLAHDEGKLFFGNPADIDLDMNSIINPKFCGHAARDYV
jgi:hypothetical protein